jgi:hypothetical protein
MGETPDKRGRGGLKVDTDGSWKWHCFNCGYVTGFSQGKILSLKSRRLLEWLGVDETMIEYINLESLRHKSIYGIIEEHKQHLGPTRKIRFESKELPDETELLDQNNPAHEKFVKYLKDRAIDPSCYPFMVGTGNGEYARDGNRIVIPFTHNNRIVGHSSRYLDNKKRKYIHDIQPGYVFGADLQMPEWTTAIVVEGVFDALAINGLAVLHNTVNDEQSNLINSLRRDIIVVPDQDISGQTMISRAIEMGWAVSIPQWDHGIKDVADAVRTYGRLGALLAIMEAAHTSKIKIELMRMKLDQRIRN